MDDIENLRVECTDITTSQLQDLMHKQFNYTSEVKEEQNQRLDESAQKIQELTSKLASLKENFKYENQIVEHKKSELFKYNNLVAELEKERNKFLKENCNLEAEKTKLKLHNPNLHDKKLLEEGKKKLKIYKAITGIKWDYSVLKEHIQGYVTNKTDYIHHFSYENDDPAKLRDVLWNEVLLSTGHIEENMINK